MLTYPIHTESDDTGFLVTCPDLPEVATDADRIEDAPARAAEAIGEALAARLGDFDPITLPSEGGVRSAPVDPYISVKALLAKRLADAGETRAGLARRLGWHRNSVDRLFHPRHATKLDQFTAAFHALASEMRVEIDDREGTLEPT